MFRALQTNKATIFSVVIAYIPDSTQFQRPFCQGGCMMH